MELTLTRGDGPVPPSPLPPEPLRVAFCIDGMGVGGTEMNAIRTAERLDPERYQVVVVALNGEGPLRQRYGAAGIPVETFPIGSLVGARALRQGLRLRQFLVARGIDVVHSHDLYTNAFVTPWARAARVPAVITSRRWESFPRPVHRVLNVLAYRASHCVLANSQLVAALVRAETGLPAGRIEVVPNFVDEAAMRPMEPEARARLLASIGVPAGALVVGVIANLTPIKDHATLLRAIARLAGARPELHAVLVGEGPTRASLEELAKELGVEDRVHFAGTRPHLPNLHSAFDLSALTSLSEGFPNSVVEAMAAGRAVVATRVGGTPDAVEEGMTGLLIPPRDVPALAAALDALLADPGRRRAMGELARARAETRYSASLVLSTLERLYARLTAGAAAGRRRAA